MVKEEEIDYIGKKYENPGEIDFYIEKLENSIPDKRTKTYQEWLKNVNFLIEYYNKMVGEKRLKKYD